MNRKKKICMSFLAASFLLAGCTSIDEGNISQTQQAVEEQSVSEEAGNTDSAKALASTAEEASIENSDASSAMSSDASSEMSSEADYADADFYYYELKSGENKKVDLGNDGEDDTLFFKHPKSDEKDHSCYIKINDKQRIDILLLEENKFLYGEATAIYVHRDDEDYIMVENDGMNHYGTITLYKWNKDTFENISELSEGSYKIDFDKQKNSDEREYKIYPDKVVIASIVECFGRWIGTQEYSYDESGMMSLDLAYKIRPLVETENNAYTLKKDMTFDDESGDGPKTVKAGTKVVPYSIRRQAISFCTEDGEYLGYMDCGSENPEDILEGFTSVDE